MYIKLYRFIHKYISEIFHYKQSIEFYLLAAVIRFGIFKLLESLPLLYFCPIISVSLHKIVMSRFNIQKVTVVVKRKTRLVRLQTPIPVLMISPVMILPCYHRYQTMIKQFRIFRKTPMSPLIKLLPVQYLHPQ